MKESIQDAFRLWYMEHKRIYGKFPEFPDDEVWQKVGFRFVAPVEGQVIPEIEQPKEETKGMTFRIDIKKKQRIRKAKMMYEYKIIMIIGRIK